MPDLYSFFPEYEPGPHICKIIKINSLITTYKKYKFQQKTKITFHMFSAKVTQDAGDIFSDYATALPLNKFNETNKLNVQYGQLFASQNIPEIVNMFHGEASVKMKTYIILFSLSCIPF